MRRYSCCAPSPGPTRASCASAPATRGRRRRPPTPAPRDAWPVARRVARRVPFPRTAPSWAWGPRRRSSEYPAKRRGRRTRHPVGVAPRAKGGARPPPPRGARHPPPPRTRPSAAVPLPGPSAPRGGRPRARVRPIHRELRLGNLSDFALVVASVAGRGRADEERVCFCCAPRPGRASCSAGPRWGTRPCRASSSGDSSPRGCPRWGRIRVRGVRLDRCPNFRPARAGGRDRSGRGTRRRCTNDRTFDRGGRPGGRSDSARGGASVVVPVASIVLMMGQGAGVKRGGQRNVARDVERGTPPANMFHTSARIERRLSRSVHGRGKSVFAYLTTTVVPAGPP